MTDKQLEAAQAAIDAVKSANTEIYAQQEALIAQAADVKAQAKAVDKQIAALETDEIKDARAFLKLREMLDDPMQRRMALAQLGIR